MKVSDVLVHPNFVGLVMVLAGCALCLKQPGAGLAVITGGSAIMSGAHQKKDQKEQ